MQRRRTKGWKKPEGAVYVSRGSQWGNPFMVGVDGDAAECVRKYAHHMMPYRHHRPDSGMDKCLLSIANYEAIRELRGKTLMCFSAEDAVCHGDWLLKVANE